MSGRGRQIPAGLLRCAPLVSARIYPRPGARYPRAIDALKLRRDAARAALEKGTTDREVAVDFAAHNENLGEQQQTLAVYDALKGRNPLVAETLFDDVWGLLLHERRYAELVANAGNIADRVDQQIAMYTDTRQRLSSDKQLLAYMKEHVLEQSCGYYEALVGVDKVAEARAIRDKLLKLDGGAATYVALVPHAVRADRPAIVQELIARAKEALGPADLKRVEDAHSGH